MKLNIPDIGDLITLSSNWTFTLHPEGRNVKLAKFFDLEHARRGEEYWAKPEALVALDTIYKNCKGIVFDYAKHTEMVASFIKNNPDIIKGAFEVELERGTTLGVDRVYIRKGAREFSSLSFFIKNGPFKGARFWAKLDEVNKIEIE
jgi:hypothetical protein